MNEKREKFDRREFLKTTAKSVAGAALAAGGFGAIAQQAAYGESRDDPDEYDFLMPRVKFDCTMRVGDYWNCFPGGDRNLLLELEAVVRCKVKLPPNCRDDRPHHGQESQFNAVVDFTDMEPLRKFPFLFMTASGPYKLGKKKKKHLRQYINEGGFLLMDDCVHRNEALFYYSSYELLEDVFGAGAVKRIPNEHEVFHNVYDLGRIGLPYVQGQDYGARGVFVGDRLAVFLSATDIHCGWTERGKHNAKQAVQMGINTIMYALSH